MLKYWFFLSAMFIVLVPSQAQQQIPGWFDLSQANNSQQEIILEGQWEFYWDTLLAPGHFPDQKTYYDYPALWNDGIVNGEPLQSKGYATYRSFVVLPDTGEYMIHVEDAYSAYRLFVNGQILAENGRVADNKAAYTPYWKAHFIKLPEGHDTLELVLQIANFDHAKGGALEGMGIGHAAFMHAKELKTIARDLVLTGSLIMGGLFFLGLYFFGRHDKAILYFSLFCIVYAYRIVGFGYYVLHDIVNWSWYVTTKLEYLSLFLATFLFGRFVQNLYPQEARPIVWKIVSFSCLVFIGLTVVSPASVYTHTVEPFFVILLFYLVLAFIIFIRAYLRRRPGSQYAVISSGVVFSVFAYNIMVYFGALEKFDAASFWGYMLFFFSQSLILSYRFAYFLTNAKVQAEQAALAKTEFLSTISHEIRTPLNAVVGISHFLLEDNPRKDQTNNLVSLKYSAEHLTALINDILDYNKLESGFVDFEELDTDLEEVVQSIFTSYKPKADNKGVELKLDFDQSIQQSVITDKTRLTQILNNLTDNAIKFTKEGSVTIRVKEKAEEPKHRIILFEVEDTGIGIPKDKHQAIFERFTQASSSTTREFGGTGLGLAIIKRLLELQGVAIQVESEPGSGTRFYFVQRFKKGAVIDRTKSNVEAKYLESKLHGKKVLLVEDNAMNVMVAEQFLVRWQMQMDVANNGVEAVRKASNNFYDIILMDLQMPEMDGYTAAREIRGQKNPVPIVALTASALVSIQEKVLMSGMNDYVTKPFNPEELKYKLVKNIKS